MANPKLKRQEYMIQKREEAEERQRAYDALTVEQKIEKLDRGGFNAIKQRARLTEQLKESKE